MRSKGSFCIPTVDQVYQIATGKYIKWKDASTGDGILTSLKMMEVMLAKKKPMSELAAPLKIYPQVLENVRVTDKKAAQNQVGCESVMLVKKDVLILNGQKLPEDVRGCQAAVCCAA